jgi:DNA-binding NarL/FixJ family response regulator
MPSRKRVLIVADTLENARRLEGIFSDGFTLSRVVLPTGGEELRGHSADVIVCVNQMAAQLAARQRKMPVLELGPAAMGEGQASGTHALLPDKASAEEIRAAAVALAAGLHFAVQPPPNPESDFAYFEPLTEREREVLNLVAEGLSTPEIANELGVSRTTVKFHVSSIMGKLGAGSRTEAVALGLRRGLVII